MVTTTKSTRRSAGHLLLFVHSALVFVQLLPMPEVETAADDAQHHHQNEQRDDGQVDGGQREDSVLGAGLHRFF